MHTRAIVADCRRWGAVRALFVGNASIERLTRRWLAPVAVLVACMATGLARIVATYPVFNQTWDEPAHIAAGMEWIDRGTYTYEPLHPPLARVLTAIGPRLAGVRSGGHENVWLEGNSILYAGGRYDRNLALARLGVLPFFLLASLVVFLWANRIGGLPTADRRPSPVHHASSRSCPRGTSHDGHGRDRRGGSGGLLCYGLARSADDPTQPPPGSIGWPPRCSPSSPRCSFSPRPPRQSPSCVGGAGQ